MTLPFDCLLSKLTSKGTIKTNSKRQQQSEVGWEQSSLVVAEETVGTAECLTFSISILRD